MLGLSATYNYFLFNGSVDMRKGIYSLSAVVRDEMSGNPLRGKFRNPLFDEESKKMSTFTPMIDERMYDLLRSQLAVANDEKAGLCDQIKSLTKEIGILRSTLQGENALLRSTVSELSSKVGYLLEILQAKDTRISSLETDLLNAHSLLSH